MSIWVVQWWASQSGAGELSNWSKRKKTLLMFARAFCYPAIDRLTVRTGEMFGHCYIFYVLFLLLTRIQMCASKVKRMRCVLVHWILFSHWITRIPTTNMNDCRIIIEKENIICTIASTFGAHSFQFKFYSGEALARVQCIRPHWRTLADVIIIVLSFSFCFIRFFFYYYFC